MWWLIAFVGAASVFTGATLPYYRFMNASAAPMVVVASLGFVLNDGLENRWVSESNQWPNQQVPEFEFGLDLILDGLERLLTMTDASGFDR